MQISKVFHITSTCLLCFLCIFILPVRNLEAGSIYQALSQIPENDRKEIKLLFEHLFKQEVFGYSLFYNKPFSFSEPVFEELSTNDFIKILRIEGYAKHILSGYEPKEVFIRRWKTWEKYSNKFQTPNYIFKKCHIFKYTAICIINKNAFLRTLETFTVGGQNISGKALLDRFSSEDIDFFELLGRRHDTLGVLLGFGEYNSKLYQKREELEHSLLERKQIFYSEEKTEIHDQLEKLCNILQPSNKFYMHNISNPNVVAFTGDFSHPETSRYFDLYIEQGQQLSEILSKDDWFEQTLIQLTSD